MRPSERLQVGVDETESTAKFRTRNGDTSKAQTITKRLLTIAGGSESEVGLTLGIPSARGRERTVPLKEGRPASSLVSARRPGLFHDLFKRSVQALGMGKGNLDLYLLRRGGANQDLLSHGSIVQTPLFLFVFKRTLVLYADQ